MAKSKLNIGQYKYGQEIENQLARGKSLEKAHKIASSPIMKKSDKFDKPSAGSRVILAFLRALKGKKKAKHGKVSKTNAR